MLPPTLSVLVGDDSCNAKCEFCPSQKIVNLNKAVKFDDRGLIKAFRYARFHGVTTCLITSKGEPLLFPEMVNEVCNSANDYFPVIELQTNGYYADEDVLSELYENGLNTVAVSIAHHNDATNNIVFGFKKQPSLVTTIKRIHDNGMNVRLNCMMIKDFIDSVEKVDGVIEFCQKNNVEFLTLRTIPTRRLNLDNVSQAMRSSGSPMATLPFGGAIYYYKGQNVCIDEIITGDHIRHLVYHPDGHLYQSWTEAGMVF